MRVCIRRFACLLISKSSSSSSSSSVSVSRPYERHVGAVISRPLKRRARRCFRVCGSSVPNGRSLSLAFLFGSQSPRTPVRARQVDAPQNKQGDTAVVKASEHGFCDGARHRRPPDERHRVSSHTCQIAAKLVGDYSGTPFATAHSNTCPLAFLRVPLSHGQPFARAH